MIVDKERRQGTKEYAFDTVEMIKQLSKIEFSNGATSEDQTI